MRAAAPILARQHAANPTGGATSSRSTPSPASSGSSRNSAYAGSKFGGIGLTQSFALELVGDGIKVNAVCPGNFFDGPLWSDPDNGLFVPVPARGQGARRHDRRRRPPRLRGQGAHGPRLHARPTSCEAILYLVAQQYETGQALPVTGGQVMLS